MIINFLNIITLSLFFFHPPPNLENNNKLGIVKTEKKEINKYLEYLKTSDLELNRIAVRKLSGFKDKAAVDALIKALSSKDYEVRFYAKKSLVKLGEFSLTFILKEISNPNPIIRLGLIECLGDIKNKKANPRLISTLKKDNDPKVREACAKSLGKIGDSSAINQLILSLKDRDYRVRTASAGALGFIGDKKATNSLVKALNDKNSYVRSSSAAALGRIKDKTAVPYLINALKDSSFETREMACWSLGKIRDKRAVRPLLHTLIKDSNVTVRKEAREALLQMGYTSKQIDRYKQER